MGVNLECIAEVWRLYKQMKQVNTVVCECMEAGLGTPGVETLEAGGAGTKSATTTKTCLNRASLSSQVVLKFILT